MRLCKHSMMISVALKEGTKTMTEFTMGSECWKSPPHLRRHYFPPWRVSSAPLVGWRRKLNTCLPSFGTGFSGKRNWNGEVIVLEELEVVEAVGDISKTEMSFLVFISS